MTVEEEVRGNIARLLALVCDDNTDPEAYEFVLTKLTRIAILGTLPAGSRSTKTSDDADEDQSLAKERWIAP